MPSEPPASELTSTSAGHLRVAFVGLGQMGAPMASNLAAAGYELLLHNRSIDKARALAEALAGYRVEVVDRAATAAEAADVVVTMLADDNAVGTVYRDERGLLPALRPATLVIDMSTIGPEAARELGADVADRCGRFVEAPVSGSVAAARGGTLMIMAGGDRADVEAAEPVLRTMGDRIHHVGPVGAGAAMKLVVNAIVYGLNQAVSEALVLAERAGIDRLAAYAVVADSAAAAPFVHYRRAAFEDPGAAPAAMRMTLADKDMRLIEELADAVGGHVPQSRLNREVLREAIDRGLGAQDIALVTEFLRGRVERG
jgi:3-hydroxyisobutyrate dehydrogenase-like beta-hydroxyacid dehydrogenase